jgi:hypothetical protein
LIFIVNFDIFFLRKKLQEHKMGLEIKSTRLNWGGWLIRSGSGETIKIGVIAETESQAEEKFSAAIARWREIISGQARI